MSRHIFRQKYLFAQDAIHEQVENNFSPLCFTWEVDHPTKLIGTLSVLIYSSSVKNHKLFKVLDGM